MYFQSERWHGSFSTVFCTLTKRNFLSNQTARLIYLNVIVILYMRTSTGSLYLSAFQWITTMHRMALPDDIIQRIIPQDRLEVKM